MQAASWAAGMPSIWISIQLLKKLCSVRLISSGEYKQQQQQQQQQQQWVEMFNIHDRGRKSELYYF